MSDESRVFETGARRDNADGKGRMDLLPWNAIIELSKHCERGAKHYGENNVRMGIPFHSLADSGARHLAKWIAGIQDEPTHLVAACWNLMWLLEQTITKPELNDMPWVNPTLSIFYGMINNEPVYRGRTPEHPDDVADRLKKIAESGDQYEYTWGDLCKAVEMGINPVYVDGKLCVTLPEKW